MRYFIYKAFNTVELASSVCTVLLTAHSHFELSHIKIYCLEKCTDMIKHACKTGAAS